MPLSQAERWNLAAPAWSQVVGTLLSESSLSPLYVRPTPVRIPTPPDAFSLASQRIAR